MILLLLLMLGCGGLELASGQVLQYYPSGLPGKYPPVIPDPEHVRQESVSERKLFEFKSYRDGQLFHFEVPLDTKYAIWTFKTNYSRACRPRPVAIYLKAGSYPVVNPKDGRFPDKMKPLGSLHNTTFNPENGQHNLRISSPLPGSWFMLAYSIENKFETLAEKSLTTSRCATWLKTEVEYQLESNVIHLFPEKHNHQKLYLYHNIDRAQTYRFYTGSSVWSASVTLTKCKVRRERGLRMGSAGSAGSNNERDDLDDSCPVVLAVEARKPPDVRNPKTRKRDCLKDSEAGMCSLKLFPEEDAWHFITISPTRTDRRVEFAINVVITDCPHPTEKINYFLANKINPHEVCSEVTKNTGSAIQLLFPPYQASGANNDVYKKCGQRIRLVRKSLPGVFMFEYQLPPHKAGFMNSSVGSPMSLQLENDLASVLQFPVGLSDIGGSLVLELGVNIAKLSGISSETIHLKACLSHGKRLIPTLVAHFDPYGPATPSYPMEPPDIINSKNKGPQFFREREEEREEAALCPGGRLISINVSAAERIASFQRVMVPYPAVGEWFLTLLPSCSQVNVRRGNQETTYESTRCSQNETPVVLSIYSDKCVMGSCGKYGRCYQFFSGGNMFSTCTCFAGYKGWGCTDASEATSEIDLLAATLLLCLSNLLFLPAVGLAIYRGFYTESFVYFANMVFSTLFHACDQDVFSFCLMKYSVLQFCDYYATTMSYWVTVLAMGGMPDQAKSLLHMVGAIGVALGIEYDRSGVFTFLVPGVIGILILFASWISHCSSDHSCYPGLKYTCCFFFPGLAVLAGGLFCFMILEEESNYQFVHSAWHISMAVAILFLLPQSPPTDDLLQAETDKYTILNSRTSFPPAESSFKHISADDTLPPGDLINVTSSAATILPPDQVVDVSRAPSMPSLHNGPGISGAMATLPRSNMAARGRPQHQHVHSYGTMKRQQQQLAMTEEVRPLIAQRPPDPG